MKNKLRAGLAIDPSSHTRHAATAIMIKSSVQAGPKTQVGGLKNGLFKVGYQSRTDWAVTNPDTPPTPRQRIKKPASTNHLCIFNSYNIPLFAPNEPRNMMAPMKATTAPPLNRNRFTMADSLWLSPLANFMAKSLP